LGGGGGRKPPSEFLLLGWPLIALSDDLVGLVIGDFDMFDGLLGAVVSGIGGVVQNQMNQDEAQRNRDFQTQMSNTAYQRGMKDMKAAGLNPILAYQKGPASSPTGNAAVATNVGEQMVSGYNTARRVEADVPKTEADTALSKSNALLSAEQIKNAVATNENIRANTAASVAQAKLSAEQAKFVGAQTAGATSQNSAKEADKQYYDSWFGKGMRWIGNSLNEINPLKGWK